ncbi:ttn-1 [Symbiodinium sp. CCMP2456]|nr:ttn-1 [Symbiodinium sp. CCMP2456]
MLIQVPRVCVLQSCRLVRHGRNYRLELYWTRKTIGVREKNGTQVWSMRFSNMKVGVLVANEVVSICDSGISIHGEDMDNRIRTFRAELEMVIGHALDLLMEVICVAILLLVFNMELDKTWAYQFGELFAGAANVTAAVKLRGIPAFKMVFKQKLFMAMHGGNSAKSTCLWTYPVGFGHALADILRNMHEGTEDVGRAYKKKRAEAGAPTSDLSREPKMEEMTPEAVMRQRVAAAGLEEAKNMFAQRRVGVLVPPPRRAAQQAPAPPAGAEPTTPARDDVRDGAKEAKEATDAVAGKAPVQMSPGLAQSPPCKRTKLGTLDGHVHMHASGAEVFVTADGRVMMMPKPKDMGQRQPEMAQPGVASQQQKPGVAAAPQQQTTTERPRVVSPPQQQMPTERPGVAAARQQPTEKPGVAAARQQQQMPTERPRVAAAPQQMPTDLGPGVAAAPQQQMPQMGHKAQQQMQMGPGSMQQQQQQQQMPPQPGAVQQPAVRPAAMPARMGLGAMQQQLPVQMGPALQQQMPVQMSQMPAQMQQQLPAQMSPQMQQQLPAQMSPQMQQQMPAPMSPQMQQQMPAQMRPGMHQQMPAHMSPGMQQQMPTQVFAGSPLRTGGGQPLGPSSPTPVMMSGVGMQGVMPPLPRGGNVPGGPMPMPLPTQPMQMGTPVLQPPTDAMAIDAAFASFATLAGESVMPPSLMEKYMDLIRECASHRAATEVTKQLAEGQLQMGQPQQSHSAQQECRGGGSQAAATSQSAHQSQLGQDHGGTMSQSAQQSQSANAGSQAAAMSQSAQPESQLGHGGREVAAAPVIEVDAPVQRGATEGQGQVQSRNDRTSPDKINSQTHPEAWGALYRYVMGKSSKGKTPEVRAEILQKWQTGGLARNKLLKDFIEKCYQPGNARLEAVFKIRQISKDWRNTIKGFEWLTADEMKKLGWPEKKVLGAISHCEKKKLYKKCPYEGTRKYLVQVSDRVEHGSERLRELEEMMEDCGTFNENFDMSLGIGDLLEEDDEQSADPGSKKPKPTGSLPRLEGEESVTDYLSKFKKACLSIKKEHRDVLDKLVDDKVSGHESKKDFNDITDKVKDALLRFTNSLNACKPGVRVVENVLKTYIDHNAAAASTIAFDNAQTVEEGDPWKSTFVQLGLAHNSTSDKESVFLGNVQALGFMLQCPVSMKTVQFPTGPKAHPVLSMKALATEILRDYPRLLFFGHEYTDLKRVENTLADFWERFRHTWPDHDIYITHHNNLSRCIPIRVHADEGTSFRRAAIYQQSWGPVLKAGAASFLHCFFYTAMLADEYKDDNAGYAAGNKTLDSLMKHFVQDAKECYMNGVPSRNGKFFLVLIRLEGDLPAQGKLTHSARNYTNDPNPMCPWCLADGKEVPFGDFRRTARWRETLDCEPPWGSSSPLHDLPGGEDVRFISRDLFHISHLGIARTCVASVICYLVAMGHFQPRDSGTSVPACLQEAYKDFAHFCKWVLGETPDIKTFSRANLQWTSLAKMPESSMKGSDVRLVTRWLADYLCRPWLLDATLENVYRAVTALDDFHRLCYVDTDRVWMNAVQMRQARRHAGIFLSAYATAAGTCHSEGKLFFNITPKYHYFLHIEHELRISMGQEWGFNPACWATQMDEDYMGVSSRMSRATHPLGAAKRTAQRWLIHSWLKWKDWKFHM